MGIEIRAGWNWLLVRLRVIWYLGTTFAGIHRDWGLALTWGTAVVAALLFFGSMLAHELAHSLVVGARVIPVRDITLFLFGGVSDIQREPASPMAKLLIAIVEPLTSIVPGGVLVLLAGADVRQRPVPRDGELVGLLRRCDVIKWLQLHAESVRGRAG